MKVQQITSMALCTTALLALAGCGGGSDSSSTAPTGTLGLHVTDAPVDSANRVVVQFDGIEIQPANGERITFNFDSPRQIDLLSLQGNNSEPLVEGEEVPAGDYEWLRVMITGDRQSLESFIEMDDGRQYPLFVPSGSETGLKLVSGFAVPVGGAADFTIDFDLRKSVAETGRSGEPYILKPALRLVDNSAIGSISGTVDTATATSGDCSAPAAYVYSGAGVSPDDEGSDTSPLTSAIISMDEDTGEFVFTVGFLSEGDYTVAWTCLADADEPDTDDDILFEGSVDASVTADETTEVAF